jgi:predicted dehydrogenase
MSANSKGKIRTGIVGIGNWGRYGHIPVLELLPDFQIVAVSSRRQEYASSTGTRRTVNFWRSSGQGEAPPEPGLPAKRRTT